MLTLSVDGPRWRQHLLDTARAQPGLVPVAKGNGYGFGNGRLARRTQWLAGQLAGEGADVRPDLLAVGTYGELPQVAQRFAGDLLVLTPWRPFGASLATFPGTEGRIVHTVSRPEDLLGLLAQDPDARFVLEELTSMRRHGMSRHQLREAGVLLRSRRYAGLEGIALHLPLATSSHVGEVTRLVQQAVAAGLPTRTVFVSHLSARELEKLRAEFPDFTFRPRIGTDLWLGVRDALQVTATVLDAHPVSRGERYGYRQRSAPRDGHLLVVSGGTAHGIGLEAPSANASLLGRAATLARGGLDAAGFVRSPFSVDGRQRLFAEPPHMQASMLFLPRGSRVPAIGEEVDVRCRFTATDVDRVLIS